MKEENKAGDPRLQVLVTLLHQWGMTVEHAEARGLLAKLDKAVQAKPRTLRDALGELPEPYRSLALANEKHKTGFDWDGVPGMVVVESPRQALDSAFHWQKTPQGRGFWQKVYDGEFPPIPEPVASDEEVSAVDAGCAMEYEVLEPREIMREGDEVEAADGNFYPLIKSGWDRKVAAFGEGIKVRRKISRDTPLTYSGLPAMERIAQNRQDQYTYLNPHDEIQEGDEFKGAAGWSPVAGSALGAMVVDLGIGAEVRRKKKDDDLREQRFKEARELENSLREADAAKVRPFPTVPLSASEQAQLNKDVEDWTIAASIACEKRDWTASQLSATGMHQISQEDRARLQVRAEKIETIQVLIDLAKCYDSMHGAKDEILTKAKNLALEL